MKPCPWCNSKRTRLFTWDPRTHYVECLKPGCRASGPARDTPAHALVAWDDGPRPYLRQFQLDPQTSQDNQVPLPLEVPPSHPTEE